MKEFFPSQPEYSTINLQDISVSNHSEIVALTLNGASDEQSNWTETTPIHNPVRRGPGRPKKPRSTEKVVRPRCLQDRIQIENPNQHHGHSNDSSSISSAERRYRRMRDLNVLGIQRSRFKRKSKMQIALDELKREKDKKKELSMKVRILEEQIKALKHQFTTNTSNPQQIVVLTAPPNTVCNAEQFKSFVKDVARMHLEENCAKS